MNLESLLNEFDKLEEPVRETYVRAPFSYPGGKYKSLKHILPELPYRKSYISVCGGSGVDLINRRPSELEVYNDRYGGVVAFYRCLRDFDKRQKLIERLKCVVHSREEFVWCANTWENCTDDIERAARWYYMLRLSFASIGRNFGRSTAGPNSMGIKYWKSLKLFPIVGQRFQHVQIENLDAIQCIRDYDTFDSVFYVDPDYQDTTIGLYQHGVDHKHLLDTIFLSKGFFAVSGYPNNLYDSYPWDKRKEWKVSISITPGAFTESNNLKNKRDVMQNQRAIEVLWIKEAGLR